MSDKNEEYNPIMCNHIKPNGWSAYTLLSHSSGSGPDINFECNIRVCLLCGQIRVSGKKYQDEQMHYFDENFSIDLPDAVAAIVKNCNYMNSETDDYIPFQRLARSANE